MPGVLTLALHSSRTPGRTSAERGGRSSIPFPDPLRHMTAIDWVRQFFEEQLTGLEAEAQRFLPGASTSTQHLISHLVEQTVRRAALDAAIHGDGTEEGKATDVSWERCLMVAALTELRSIKLLARNRM